MAKKEDHKDELNFHSSLASILENKLTIFGKEKKLREELVGLSLESNTAAEKNVKIQETLGGFIAENKNLSNDIVKGLKEQMSLAEDVTRVETKRLAVIDQLKIKAKEASDKLYPQKKMDKIKSTLEGFTEPLRKIPIVGGKAADMLQGSLSKSFDKTKRNFQAKVIKNMRKNMSGVGKAGASGMKAFGKAGIGAARSVGMAIMSIPIVGWIAAIIAGMVALMAMASGADKHISEMAKGLSMSKAEAIELEKALHKSDKTTGELAVSMKNALPILSAWKTEMGSINTLSIEELKLLERTTFNLGLSAENAAKIAIVGKTSGKTAKETLTTINDTTNEYNKQRGLGFDIKDTLDDIANVSSNVQAMFSGNTEELTKQVLEARRLGTTLDKMQSTANNQLNIDTSIGAQMEANVLTGARLNFDKAKGLGLAGDFAGMQDEILNQVESIANWDELSWKSKQKVAEASGMELGELQKSLTVRKLNSIVRDDMMDSLMKAEKARRNGIEGAEEELKQLKMKAGIEGDMAFDEALKEQSRASAMESFDRSIDLLKEKFTAKVANGMGKLLDQLAKAGEYLASGGSLTGLLFKDFSSDEEKEAKSKEAMANAKKSTDSGMRNAASQIESREKGESTIRVVTGMKAADGAMVKATPGGVHTIVAEAGQDEAVVPLTEFYAKLDHIVSAIKESSSSTQPQPVEVLVDFGDGPRERLFTRQKNVSRIGNNLGLG